MLYRKTVNSEGSNTSAVNLNLIFYTKHVIWARAATESEKTQRHLFRRIFSLRNDDMSAEDITGQLQSRDRNNQFVYDRIKKIIYSQIKIVFCSFSNNSPYGAGIMDVVCGLKAEECHNHLTLTFLIHTAKFFEHVYRARPEKPEGNTTGEKYRPVHFETLKKAITTLPDMILFPYDLSKINAIIVIVISI